jgi:hypothetical protein
MSKPSQRHLCSALCKSSSMGCTKIWSAEKTAITKPGRLFIVKTCCGGSNTTTQTQRTKRSLGNTCAWCLRFASSSPDVSSCPAAYLPPGQSPFPETSVERRTDLPCPRAASCVLSLLFLSRSLSRNSDTIMESFTALRASTRSESLAASSSFCFSINSCVASSLRLTVGSSSVLRALRGQTGVDRRYLVEGCIRTRIHL